MHLIFICYLLMLICCITTFDNILMLTIFHVQNVLIIVDWCLCDFLVTETYWWSGCTSFSFLNYWCWYVALLLLIIYWCWLFFMCKMFLSFSTDVYVIFSVLKHIDEVDALHICLLIIDVDMLHSRFWSFTDVDYFSCAKCSYHCRLMFMWFSLYWNILMKWMHLIFICYLLMLICCITAFDNILMLTIFHVQNVLIILDWCSCDFLCTETYWWSGCTSFSFVIDIFFLWKIFYNFNTAFDYLLMLTIFHVQNVVIILDWCLCDFLCTETYWWSGCT